MEYENNQIIFAINMCSFRVLGHIIFTALHTDHTICGCHFFCWIQRILKAVSILFISSLEHVDTSDVSSLIQIQIYRFPICNHVKCQKAFFCHKTYFIFYIIFLCDTPKFKSFWGCNVKLGFEGAPAKLFWFFVDRLSFDVSNICCHLQRSVKCKTYMVLKGDSCNLYDVLDCCKMYKKCNALNSKPYKDIFKGLQN